jgi:hypothetical protein
LVVDVSVGPKMQGNIHFMKPLSTSLTLVLG